MPRSLSSRTTLFLHPSSPCNLLFQSRLACCPPSRARERTGRVRCEELPRALRTLSSSFMTSNRAIDDSTLAFSMYLLEECPVRASGARECGKRESSVECASRRGASPSSKKSSSGAQRPPNAHPTSPPYSLRNLTQITMDSLLRWSVRSFEAQATESEPTKTGSCRLQGNRKLGAHGRRRIRAAQGGS